MKKEKKMNRRQFIKVTSAAGVALGFSALTGPYVIGQEKKKPIKIGACIPYTGRFSRIATYAIDGYKLWAKNINESGYSFGNEHLSDKKPGLIDGRPVELIILDDGSDPTTTARLMMQLIHSEKVDLLLGAFASVLANASRPVIEEAQIPCINAFASSNDIWEGKNGQWVVQIMCPTKQRFPGLEILCKQAGYSKVAILYMDDAMPIAASKALHRRLVDGNFDIVLYDAFPIGIRDLVPVIRKARSAGAEVLAGGALQEENILMAKAALSLNWAPKVFWHMGDFVIPDFKNALGKNIAWHCGDGEWLPEANWSGNKEFVNAYNKEYGRNVEWVAASGYAAGQILEEAVKRAGSVEDKKAIRDFLFSIERDTVFGHYKVNPLGHPDAGLQIGASRVALQYQLEKDEPTLKVIWPPQIATAKLAHPFHWEKI